MQLDADQSSQSRQIESIRTSKRAARPEGDVQHIAEIVTRSLLDRHGVSIDRIMADPVTRAEFNLKVRGYGEKVDTYAVRKTAFQLRKARKLRPELITRIADWDREITSFTIEQFRADNKLVRELPGIYIFHDDSGYLYIGQSDNLRKRLKTHLDKSSNAALASLLSNENPNKIRIEIHSFPVDSRAKEVTIRRAYESELIRSRKPKFNILP